MIRDKIARIVTLDHLQLLQDFDVDPDIYRMDPECRDGALATADAIIAALPDMIPDLVWETVDSFTTRSGAYRISKAPFEYYWRLFHDDGVVDLCKVVVTLREVANSHHRSTIMEALGVTS